MGGGCSVDGTLGYLGVKQAGAGRDESRDDRGFGESHTALEIGDQEQWKPELGWLRVDGR